MAALTALAMAVGAAASVAGVVQARNNTKDLKKETARQKQAAKEAAALESTADTADAEFQLGVNDPTSERRTKGSAKKKPAAVTSGMATGGISPSSVGGL